MMTVLSNSFYANSFWLCIKMNQGRIFIRAVDGCKIASGKYERFFMLMQFVNWSVLANERQLSSSSWHKRSSRIYLCVWHKDFNFFIAVNDSVCLWILAQMWYLSSINTLSHIHVNLLYNVYARISYQDC